MDKIYALKKKSMLLIIIIGICFLISVFLIATRQDLKNETSDMHLTMQYVNAQFLENKKLNTVSEAKSLSRMTDKMNQALYSIADDGGAVSTDSLQALAQRLRLTGMIIMNADGELICEYADGRFSYRELKTALSKKALLDVSKNPRKLYTRRINLSDHSYIDIGAHKKTDSSDIVVCYYHTPVRYVENYNVSLQKLFAGYSVQSAGTIVVSDGYNIVSSNVPSLVNMPVETNKLVAQLKENGHKDKLTLITDGGQKYYGMLDRGRDFFTYIYIPESEIYKTRWEKVGYAAIVYLLGVVGFMLYRRRNERLRLAEQQRLDEKYKEQLLEAVQVADRANNVKTEFLQRMSHDVRTPINGIMGMIEIARANIDDKAKVLACCNKIETSSGYLLELVNEVLDMGKLDSDKVVLENKLFDLRSLVRETVEIIDRSAAEKDVRIILDDDSIRHTHLLGSELHIKRILMNILSNAVKYNKEHGKIALSVTELEYSDNRAVFQFKCEDTGIGISKDFLPHIFDAFTQAGNAARTSYEGTGLGMAIVKSLVEKMGGSITVDSEEGRGSCFTIIMPFTVGTQDEIDEKESFNPEIVRGMHILVAEDNELNMEIAKFFLDKAGITYTAVENGLQALKAFAASKDREYDAVLMDLMMPEMDGLEATESIRRLEREDAQLVPIIAMTAKAFDEDREASFAAGMNGYITKPLKYDDLLKELSECLKNKWIVTH